MEKLVNKQNIEDVAIELGISASFVEKDLYLVELLSYLNNINFLDAKLVFTGGTCLSKAYNIIKRFSEDIDFRITTSRPFSRLERKQLRESLIMEIKKYASFKLLEDSINKGNESKFFSFDIEYPRVYKIDNILRNNLKLEFSFENLILPSSKCRIESMVSKYIKCSAPVSLDCVSLIEIGADKLSALMWRANVKDRTKKSGSAFNDPTIIRHLYDLALLEKEILRFEFKNCVRKSFERDTGRGGISDKMELSRFIKTSFNKLSNDSFFEKEYKDFVQVFSYAKDYEISNFSDAIKSLNYIINYIVN